MANKTSYDAETVRRVRGKALDEIMAILNEEERADKFSQLKKDMLMKLANNIMPRINEHSGPEGTPIPISDIKQDAL